MIQDNILLTTNSFALKFASNKPMWIHNRPEIKTTIKQTTGEKEVLDDVMNSSFEAHRKKSLETSHSSLSLVTLHMIKVFTKNCLKWLLSGIGYSIFSDLKQQIHMFILICFVLLQSVKVLGLMYLLWHSTLRACTVQSFRTLTGIKQCVTVWNVYHFSLTDMWIQKPPIQYLEAKATSQLH